MPYLTVIMCPDLPDPENGDIEYSTDLTATFEAPTTAVYKCDPGYSLVGGDTVRMCTGTGESTDGDWTGSAPTCDGKCLQLKLLNIFHL